MLKGHHTAFTSYPSLGNANLDSIESPAHVETSQPSNADAWPSQSRSNNPTENNIATRITSPKRGARKVRQAFKAIRRMISRNRATQECPGSIDSGHGHTHTPACVGQPKQDQARHPGQQGNGLPISPRTYPVRSAMRGARPKKAMDSSRRVQFAGEVRQPSQREHEIPTSPRTFPLRSAIRGSRPKQATDSSRRVHFAGGAPGRLRRDVDA